jgi:2-dehydro-3-deoxygluconokinase
MTPILHDYADILITSVYDMAKYFGIGCGQHSPAQIVHDHINDFDTEALQSFLRNVIERFALQVAAVTLRHPETFEQNGWESAAMDVTGHFFRSPRKRDMLVLDRLGGGDAWNSGFYYGLLARGLTPEGMHDGVLVGDAASRLAQTLMFDLALISRAEIQSLLEADQTGFARSTVR